jgi:hypothetical protein
VKEGVGTTNERQLVVVLGGKKCIVIYHLLIYHFIVEVLLVGLVLSINLEPAFCAVVLLSIITWIGTIKHEGCLIYKKY